MSKTFAIYYSQYHNFSSVRFKHFTLHKNVHAQKYIATCVADHTDQAALIIP